MANEAEVDLVVNVAGALPDLERNLTRIIRTAEDQAPELDVQASLDVQHSIAVMSTQLDQALRRVDATNPQIDVEAALDAQASLAGLRNDLDELTRAARSGGTDIIDLQAQLDFPSSLAEVTAAVNDLVADVERAAPEIDIEVDADRVPRAERALRSLASRARVAARGVGTLTQGVAALPLAVGGGGQAVVGLVAALQQVAPAAAVGTSALLTQKLALGTLKLALVGVEDAIKGVFDESLTADEFHESIKGLAPEARLFVDELHTMRRELRAVQQQVQNRVFKGFDDVLRQLARQTGPAVTSSLNRAADSLNAMGKSAATAAGQLADQGVLGQALNGANTALERLENTPGRVVRSFGFLAAASSPALNRIAIAVDNVSKRIADRLQRAFESGALEDSIDRAISSLAQLGRVAGNFASGVGNIFGGLTQNGRGLFDVLEDISEAFDRLTASKEFQTILGELSKTADTLVTTALPLLQEAFIQLAPVIEELAPVVREFIEKVGPELTPILQKLGPILIDIALILKEQLPTAIKLANAALAAISFALDVVKVGTDLARRGAELFNKVMESDFAKAMGSAATFATQNSGRIKEAILDWTARGIRSVSDFQNKLGDFSSDLRGKFVSGFVSAFNDTLGRMRDFANLFIGEIRKLPDRAYQTGLDIMNGIAGGLTAGIARVLSIASDIADRISSTIDNALEIRSPSRVTFRSGVFTGEGLALGLLSTAGLVATAAGTLARTIRTALPPSSGQAFGVRRINAAALRPTIEPFSGPLARSDPGALRPSDLPLRAPMQPVNVYVGNQFLAQYVDGRLTTTNARNRRILAQGVRR